MKLSPDVYDRISTPSRSWRTGGLCRHRVPIRRPSRPAGDPTGAATGTAKDVTVKDAANPTLTEVMENVGHNKISINFVWTLVTGFLVMFMQAGFALVETGFAAPRTPRTRCR